jgi:hypothetical protein
MRFPKPQQTILCYVSTFFFTIDMSVVFKGKLEINHVQKPVQMLVLTGYCYSNLKTYDITNQEV